MIHRATGRNLDTASALETQCGAKYSETLSAHTTYHQQSSAAVETHSRVWLITGYIRICYSTIRRS
jgi:hypothetical protein